MSISFKGLGENVVTFKTYTAVVGSPVTVIANDLVSKSNAGDTFCGVAASVADGYVAVQVGGFVELPYSGTAPTLGYNTVVANGNGGIKTNSTGRNVLVVNVNQTKLTAWLTLIISNSKKDSTQPANHSHQHSKSSTPQKIIKVLL